MNKFFFFCLVWINNLSAYCFFSDYVIEGCTDPEACNYDPIATEDDGSCEYCSCLQIPVISSGLHHNIGLDVGGAVNVWGNNNEGQLNVPVDLNEAIFADAGTYHTVAIKSDSTVVAWGRNNNGELNIPVGLDGVVKVAAGEYHSLALKSNGEVVGWGYNGQGVLNIPNGLRAKDISVGVNFSMALDSSGHIICWGDNGEGQCNPPQGLVSVKSVHAGYEFGYALLEDGSLVSWGRNIEGQLNFPSGVYFKSISTHPNSNRVLGLTIEGAVLAWGNIANNEVPEILIQAIKVECGALHSIAVLEDGSILSWGLNNMGQATLPEGMDLGYTVLQNCQLYSGCGDQDACNYEPGALFFNGPCYFPDCMDELACNYNADAFCSGGDCFFPGCMDPLACNYDASAGCDDGSCISPCLGCTDQEACNYDPVATEDDGSCEYCSCLQIPVISSGLHHNIGLDVTGAVNVWGNNNEGQLNVPVDLNEAIFADAGTYHTVAIKGDSTVVAWGRNNNGELNIPVGLDGVVKVAAGEYHSLALKSNGEVVGWGYNGQGVLNIPNGLRAKDISVGVNFSMALDSSGYIICWGDNGEGQCNPPQGLVSVKSIHAGYEFGYALLEDGSLVSWGRNIEGQLNFPSGVYFKSISTHPNSNRVLGLTIEGAVLAWGNIANNEVPEILIPAIKVECGALHSIVVLEDGSILSWGLNNMGQATLPEGMDLGYTVLQNCQLYSGCGDQDACNYEPGALFFNGPCYFPDCMDELACNYNADAFCSGGDCVYPSCNDPLACNYNPDAECFGGVCNFPGCTELLACNYNPLAGCDDNSCVFPGCTDPLACNYNEFAGCDDGSCIPLCLGCTDPLACNFDPNAEESNGSCEYQSCIGCTNILACNFSPSATIDDGSCVFSEQFFNCQGDCLNDIDGDYVCDELEIYGCTLDDACNFDPMATENDGSCVFPGCSDPLACNYSPLAGCDDGSCLISGCTVPNACNYNQGAFCDDGSCLFPGCTDPDASNFNQDAGCDDGSCYYSFGSLVFQDSIGHNFPNDLYVEFYISDAIDLYAAYVSLIFDTTLYNFVEGIPGVFLGQQILHSPPILTENLLEFGITKTGQVPGEIGGGLFYTLHFQLRSGIEIPIFDIESSFNVVDVDAYNDSGIVGTLISPNSFVVTLNFDAEVWPGDCDKNGVVTFLDLLPIGYFYNQQGPLRLNPSIIWSGQLAQVWGTDFSSPGASYFKTFADSNGDGLINISDQAAIGFNLGQTVPVGVIQGNKPVELLNGVMELPTDSILLSITPSPLVAFLPADSIVRVSVVANTFENNMEDLFGMGFRIVFAENWINPTSVFLDFESSDLGVLGVDFLSFTNYTMDYIEVALTRTVPMSVFGEIHLFDIVLSLDSDMPSATVQSDIVVMAANDAFGQDVNMSSTVFSLSILNQYSQLQVAVISSSTKCQNGNGGIAQAIVSGGVAPYSYNWHGSDPSNLQSGNYLLTVSDSDGVEVSVQFSIADGLGICGCTYPGASNYNPDATADDGTCLFDDAGPDPCSADFTGDGIVNTNDLLYFLAFYGSSCN